MMPIQCPGTAAAWTLAFAFLSGCGPAEPSYLQGDDQPIEAAPSASDAIDEGWFSQVRTHIENGDHRFRAEGEVVVADNLRQHLRARFGESGASIVRSVASDTGEVEESSAVELDFSAWGRAGSVRNVADALPGLGACNDVARVDEDGACVERLERDHDGILEWWDNTTSGLQQAWEIAERPRGSGEVQLVVDVRGATVGPGEGDAVELTTPDGVTISYGKLLVKDAGGRALTASLKAVGGSIVVAFDDTAARYPVTVDPFVWSDVWTVNGSYDQGRFGHALSSIGDVNGDGYDDVMISAWGRDSSKGRIFAFYGSPTGLPTTPSWYRVGTETGARFGLSVAGAGDVNGDGYSDAIVGEPLSADGGRVHVFLGSSAGFADAPASWIMSSQYAGRFGFAVSSAGDIDGDHYSDVIIGAPLGSVPEQNEGLVFLYKGSATGLGTSYAWARQSNQSGAMLGAALAGVGDINGDGLGDAVFGAPYYDGWGAIWVYVGHSGGTLGSNVMSDHGNQAGEDFGYAIAGAGDRKGDGYADFAVGSGAWDSHFSGVGRYFTYDNTAAELASSWEETSGSYAGDSMGYSLGNLGDLNGDGFGDLAANKMTTGFVDLGSGNAGVGSRLDMPDTLVVAGPGDVNGDGFGDVLFSRPSDANNRGNASLRYGAMLRPHTAFPIDADLTLASSTMFGSAMSAVGDVNGDGFGDLLIGDSTFDDGQLGAGKVFLRLGSAAGLQTTNAWSQGGGQTNAAFGGAMAGGDFNGDGYVDLAIGARTYDNGQIDEGRVSVYLGSSSGIASQTPLTLEINQANAWFGSKLASGDVNGDGYADLVVSAPYYDGGQIDEGRVFLYLGSASGLPSTTTLGFESDVAAASFGNALTMGDANCDGRADLVVGAESYSGGQSAEGKVYGYYGSSTGLTTSTFKPESDRESSRFGSAVTLDADMNGDGCADLIVGARTWELGNVGEGRIFYYPGSSSGLSSATAYLEGNQDGLLLGSVLSGGDFDADGYGDVAVGIPMLENGAGERVGDVRVYSGSAGGFPATDSWRPINQSGSSLGRALAFNGDFNGDGLSDLATGVVLPTSSGVRVWRLERGGALPMLKRAGLTTPTPPGGKSSSTSVDVSLTVRSAIGRTRAKLAVEMKPIGTPFDGTGLTKSSSWTDTGVNGVALTLRVSNLAANKSYHYRVRALYEPTYGSGGTHSRWYYGGKPGQPAGTHFRTP
jgi:hypothetical protein